LKRDTNPQLYRLVFPALAIIYCIDVGKAHLITSTEVNKRKLQPDAAYHAPFVLFKDITIASQTVDCLLDQSAVSRPELKFDPFRWSKIIVEEHRYFQVIQFRFLLAAVAEDIIINIRGFTGEGCRGLQEIHFRLNTKFFTDVQLYKASNLVI